MPKPGLNQDPLPKYSKPISELGDALARHQPIMPQIAAKLRGGGEFESRIRGSSMEPTIPGLTKIRVELATTADLAVGDIIYFLCGEGFVVHRVTHIIANATETYFITAGDNCVIPDLPVAASHVMGRLVAVEIDGEWRGVTPTVPASGWFGARRRIAIKSSVWCSGYSISLCHYYVSVLQSASARARRIARFIKSLVKWPFQR